MSTHWVCRIFGHKTELRQIGPHDYLDKCVRGCTGKWHPSLALIVRVRLTSLRCWLIDHKGPLTHYVCTRCGGTDEMTEAGKARLTLPAWLRKQFRNATGYVPGSNAREDRQRRTWRNYYVTIFGRRWGFQYAPLFINDRPYMTRYIAYLGPINLRLHKFFRGDDDRAPHNHPWWFVTFPFADYVEEVYDRGQFCGARVVRARRFHYRKASHEHIVKGPVALWFQGCPVVWDNGCQSPFWTFVIAGSKAGDWGFYPEPGKFVEWWNFKP